MINHVFISFSAVQIHVYCLSYIHFHAYHYWVFNVIKGNIVSNESIVSNNNYCKCYCTVILNKVIIANFQEEDSSNS